MPPRANPTHNKNDVFVGNIPFGTTEEQLHQIFSEAGGVVNIRLVSDHETGKPKGFAFVEYEDAATALSAIRNLNGFECNGRALRVNFSNNSSLGAEQKRGERAPQQERTVKSVVSQMSAHEVYDVVSNMKQMVEKEPDKAKQMFVSHPQVAEALLHMQVRLGMLKADDVPSLQRPPPPPVVGGAIMLGKGAQLPLLVPPMVAPPQQHAMLGPSGTYHPQQIQQQQQPQPQQPPQQQPPPQQQQYQPPLGPPTVPAPAMGWVEATTQVAPPAQFTQQQQPPQVVIQPPPPPPHIQQPQPQQHLQQPQQSQSNWGSQPVAPAVTARAESNAPRDPRDPRNRYNR